MGAVPVSEDKKIPAYLLPWYTFGYQSQYGGYMVQTYTETDEYNCPIMYPLVFFVDHQQAYDWANEQPFVWLVITPYSDYLEGAY